MCDENKEEQSQQQNQQTQQQATTSTVTPTMTPEEKEIQGLQLGAYKETLPYQTATQKAGLQFINRLLAGERDLGGFFDKLGLGISPELTSDIARQSVTDIMPQFQTSGILDSGVAASVAGRVAGDVRRSAAEYNLQNKIQLLNLALSGATNLQQPALQQAGMLNQSLAGLRPVTTTGNANINIFGNQSMTGTTTTGASSFWQPILTGTATGIGSKFGTGLFGGKVS